MKKLIIATLIILLLSACQQTPEIPKISSPIDKDQDGIDNYTDLTESARNQIGTVTKYDTNYYGNGGYPPKDSGACSDVIWRAFQDAGYNIKELLESDIVENPQSYSSASLTDSNINFRRTQNLRIFFQNNATPLTTEVIPGDESNLSQWQGGDIVTFDQIPGGLWHIALVSDKRNKDGVPLLIHNHGFGVQENDLLLDWPTEITGHFRWE